MADHISFPNSASSTLLPAAGVIASNPAKFQLATSTCLSRRSHRSCSPQLPPPHTYTHTFFGHAARCEWMQRACHGRRACAHRRITTAAIARDRPSGAVSRYSVGPESSWPADSLQASYTEGMLRLGRTLGVVLHPPHTQW
eukprot:40186-Chlamydomonas_euryale.AAC.4